MTLFTDPSNDPATDPLAERAERAARAGHRGRSDEVAEAKQRLLAFGSESDRHSFDLFRRYPYAIAGTALGLGMLVTKFALLRRVAKWAVRLLALRAAGRVMHRSND